MTRGYSKGGYRGGAPFKGQIKSGKKVQYAIEDSKGRPKYYGTTNNPSRRAAEHRKTGKLGRGDKLVVQTRAISRKSAERVEAAKLSSHRRQHGRNPKHNTTNDGRYHYVGTPECRIYRGRSVGRMTQATLRRR